MSELDESLATLCEDMEIEYGNGSDDDGGNGGGGGGSHGVDGDEIDSHHDITYEVGGVKKPKMVASYVMGRTIGEGAYGKVKEAVDIRTGRRVAIKVLRRKMIRKIKNGLEYVKREIAIMKRLKHANVVSLVEVINQVDDEETASKNIYIVMEYVVGCTLQDILDTVFPQLVAHMQHQEIVNGECNRCNPAVGSRISPEPGKIMPINFVKAVFSQLIDGLDYVHSRGVVHKDIKPGNIMITERGEVKIADFGVAERLETFEQSDNCRSLLGSPLFQPPEIASGNKTVHSGYKLDVWAAGVTLYMMVTGEYPFHGHNVMGYLESISRGEYSIPALVDPSCASLIRGMMCVDDALRFSIQQVRDHPWVQRVPMVSLKEIPSLRRNYQSLSASMLPQLKQVINNSDISKFSVSNEDGGVGSASLSTTLLRTQNSRTSLKSLPRRRSCSFCCVL